MHLTIDGVKSATGAETNYGSRPQAAVNPGVLIAGATNCVATDAVAMAVMGYDPMAVRGAAPFASSGYSMLQLGESLGIGMRDMSRNEVVGVPVSQVVFSYSAVRDKYPGRGGEEGVIRNTTPQTPATASGGLR